MIQRSRENVPATFTVKLYSKKGLTRVVGVATKGIQEDVLDYVVDTKKGERVGDWYRLGEDNDVNDVVDKAKELDRRAEIYDVEVSEG